MSVTEQNTLGAGSTKKPRLRGTSHKYAFFGFLFACALLFLMVDGLSGRSAVVVYGASVCFLFGSSAMFHRYSWPTKRAEQWMQRVDHSAIFVLIAGSYSPLFMLLPGEDYPGHPMLVTWCLASLGVLKALLWPRSPGWVTSVLAIAVGWSGALHVLALSSVMGAVACGLMVGAGIIYTLGGLVYAARRPDPIPLVFGYHEVFHAIVVVGAMTHFGHVVLVLSAARAFGR